MNLSSSNPTQQNKAVLVTGAAKRLGREIALQFARQGWDVAVHYGRSEQEAQETIREIEMMGVKVQAFRADLADDAATNNLFLAVSKAFPNLACLVNSASIFEYEYEDFEVLDYQCHAAIKAPVAV